MMNLEKFKTDTKLFGYLLMGFAILSALIFLFVFGFAVIFFIILVGWAVLVFYYLKFLVKYNFTARVIAIAVAIVVTLGVFFWAYQSPLFHKSKGTKSTTKGEVINGITMVPCTKTLADKPEKVAGTNADLYSGALLDQSVEPKDANNVRTFSLKGLTAKTEKNSFFSHFDMTDGSPITGYDDGMEVCNVDNKTNVSYNIASNDYEDIVDEPNVTARMHYFHGGKYIPQPGTYRVDQFIRDKADGKWKLVNRVEGITITD
jgi:hypothetical protein